MDAWQEVVRPIAFPTTGAHACIWAELFHPKHTSWGNDPDVPGALLQEKADALDILFVRSEAFRAAGAQVAHEFMDWARAHGHDLCLSSAAKAKAYLEERVAGAKARWASDREAGVVKHNTVEECAFSNFRNAIAHLDAIAKWQGTPLRLLEHECIRVMRDRLSQDQETARAAVRDYAASSRFLTKRLTEEECDALTTAWWDGTAAVASASTPVGQARAQMRGLLMHCLQRHLGRRGGDLRNLRLSMLFCHKLPNTRPVRSCPVIGASLRHVKECHENVEHLLGWARARNRWSCPLGALAAYLVWLNDGAGGRSLLSEIRRDLEQAHDPEAPRSWWSRMLLGGLDEGAPVSYTTHHQSVTAGYTASGIQGKTAATHIYRTLVGCELLENGTPFQDVGLYIGWQHDVSADRYLRASFKTAAMLQAHGWGDGKDGYECWWEGDDADIPDPVRHAVFPGLDDLLEMCITDGRDRSAIEFLRALQLLRRIFLEDAILKQEAYPGFPAYARHPVFQLPEWHEYKHAEMARVRERPLLASSAEEARMATLLGATIKKALQELGAAPAHAQLAAQAPVVPPPRQDRIPELKEPTCLYTAYAEWQQARGYFYAHPRPPWKEQFQELAVTMKLRFSRMRPYFQYLDNQGTEARAAIVALDNIRREHEVSPSVFIKQCFYHLLFPLGEKAKCPPIPPDVLRAAMEAVGIPPLTPAT